jgi:hypothetical protein
MSDDDAEIEVLFNKIIEFYNKTIYDYKVSLNKSIITQTTINNVLGTDYSDYTTDIDDKGNIVQVDKGEIQKVKEDVKKDKKKVDEKIDEYRGYIKYIETLRDGLDSLFNLEGNTDEDKLVAVRHFDNINIKLFGDNYKTDEHTGGSRNKPNYDTMTMKDIRELCKANQIKLSRVVNDKRVVYKKKELLTKLKRKKVI